MLKPLAFSMLLVALSVCHSMAQATTFTGGANWNGGTWSNGTPNPGSTSFTATIASNVAVNCNCSVGSLTLNASRTLTVSSGQTLTIGASGTPGTFTAQGSTTINVQSGGQLIIWGDFSASTSIQLNVRGTMTVKGNFTAGTGANVDASPSGTISVTGLTTVGSGGQLQNGGTFVAAGGCSGPGAFCSAGNLPITLTDFTATAQSNSILLTWSTSSEINFDHFELERSADGKTFSLIGQVQGHGTSKELHTYSLTDYSPSKAVNYYRLTSVDVDGTQEQFRIIACTFDGGQSHYLYPNPCDGRSVNIQLPANDGATQINVFTAAGLWITSYTLDANATQLDFGSPLTTGVYILKFSNSTFSHTERLMVR